MNNPQNRRPLTGREWELYRLFTGCQLGQPPLEFARYFRRKYDITHLQIARIARVSEVTVNRWFSSGANRCYPSSTQSFLLALMDLLLCHYQDIPEEFWELLCPLNSAQLKSRED